MSVKLVVVLDLVFFVLFHVFFFMGPKEGTGCIIIIFIISKDDIAYKKGATQSHTFFGTGFDASNAVDRNLATCTRTKDIGGRSEYTTAWWKVDLGGLYRIYSVNILFKSYDGFGVYYFDI